MNIHNNHIWDEQNRQAVMLTVFVNIWIGTVHDFLIRPYFLSPRLNGEVYYIFLEFMLPEYLKTFGGHWIGKQL